MGMRYRICNAFAQAIEMISHARDRLPKDEDLITVDEEAFDYLEAAVERLLTAYSLGVGSSVLTGQNIEKLLARIVSFEERVQDGSFFTDVKIDQDPEGAKRKKVLEAYIRDFGDQKEKAEE